MNKTGIEPINTEIHSAAGYDVVALRPSSQPEIKPALISPATIPLNTLLSKRYELKYRVPESTAVAVRTFVKSYLKPDIYTLRQPTGQYMISSLYLDSQKFDLFNETILDKCNRFKLRIRGYDDDPSSPVFFEIKRKLNRIVYKSRAKVSKDQIAPILNRHHIPSDLPEKDRTTLKQFLHYNECLQARPIVLIRYHREAYECHSESKVRVTFDRQISYLETGSPEVRIGGPGWKKSRIDFVVLEIKFTGQFPAWLNTLVRMFNLNRQSMSKYCSSVRQFTGMGGCVPSILYSVNE